MSGTGKRKMNLTISTLQELKESIGKSSDTCLRITFTPQIMPPGFPVVLMN